MWKDSERRVWQRTAATVAAQKPLLAKLLRLRPYLPQMDEQIREFEARVTMLEQAASIALEVDDDVPSAPTKGG